MVSENYRKVRARVDEACRRAGRAPEEVTLVAVSKTKPCGMIRELMADGVKDFGENYAQELVSKTEEITEPLNWHFIGNLQRNKVKYVVGRACMIHSVSSLKLLREIQKEAVKKNVTMPVLIEVNIADEQTKTGLTEAEAVELCRQAEGLSNVKIRGLMASAPLVENPEDNRGYFHEMNELRKRIAALNLPGVSMDELSMGMTHDFEVAVEEGATIVRVGTAIFGPRDYSRKD